MEEEEVIDGFEDYLNRKFPKKIESPESNESNKSKPDSDIDIDFDSYLNNKFPNLK